MPNTDAPSTIAGIAGPEYAGRLARARELAADRDLDGLVVVGRGGGPFERHADLQYLSGHYSTFPTIPDHAPHWRLRGHAALVVGADRTVLVSDDHPTASSAYADELVDTEDTIAAIRSAVERLGLRGGRVGLVGADVLGRRHLAELEAAVGSLATADDVLVPLRMIKSPAEQELLRAAGRVGSAAIGAAMDAIGSGATEQEAAAAATSVAMRSGAAVANVFTTVSGGPRPTRRHAFPSFADDAPLADGDVFAIDMSGALDGYFFDFSRTRVVGSDRYDAERVIAVARDVVEAGVAALRPGTTAGAAAAAGFAVIEAHGDDLEAGRFPALGHGLGLGFEDPWLSTDNEIELRAGMCIAIEKFVRRGPVAATFEHDVLITDGAPEILSVAPVSW